jgi:hypothetical protein
LKIVLETVTNEMRHKEIENGHKALHPQRDQAEIYRLTLEEVEATFEAEMKEIFGTEEWEAIKATDISKLPTGSKSLSEIVNEDREDRV